MCSVTMHRFGGLEHTPRNWSTFGCLRLCNVMTSSLDVRSKARALRCVCVCTHTCIYVYVRMYVCVYVAYKYVGCVYALI